MQIMRKARADGREGTRTDGRSDRNRQRGKQIPGALFVLQGEGKEEKKARGEHYREAYQT